MTTHETISEHFNFAAKIGRAFVAIAFVTCLQFGSTSRGAAQQPSQLLNQQQVDALRQEIEAYKAYLNGRNSRSPGTAPDPGQPITGANAARMGQLVNATRTARDVVSRDDDARSEPTRVQREAEREAAARASHGVPPFVPDPLSREAQRVTHPSHNCENEVECIADAESVLSYMVARHDADEHAAQAAQDAATARAAAETRSPEGATFAELTPHDHFLAATTLLNRQDCAGDERCVVEAQNHVIAMAQGHESYVQTHREEVRAILAKVQAVSHDFEQGRANARARGDAPRPNEPGGNYREVRAFLRDHLNDPRSYQPVRCAPPEAEGDHWNVECSFRAKNALGALVLQEGVFNFQQGRVVGGGVEEE